MSGQPFTDDDGGGIDSVEKSSRSEIIRRLSTNPNASHVAGPMTTSKLNNVISTAANRRRSPSRNAIHSKTG
jgi:hypothetical protein